MFFPAGNEQVQVPRSVVVSILGTGSNSRPGSNSVTRCHRFVSGSCFFFSELLPRWIRASPYFAFANDIGRKIEPQGSTRNALPQQTDKCIEAA